MHSPLDAQTQQFVSSSTHSTDGGVYVGLAAAYNSGVYAGATADDGMAYAGAEGFTTGSVVGGVVAAVVIAIGVVPTRALGDGPLGWTWHELHKN